MFDDDSVEAIKESDIPRYFGDSNAGAAYVLYYQAVDLDLSALGLRPPDSESAAASTNAPAGSSVSQTATLATTHEEDESVSSSPALPPGLTPDDQETPSPERHPSPPTFTTPFVTSAPQPIRPQPTLSLAIPVAPNKTDTIPSSPTVPTTPGGTKRLFGSLRHSPSITLRSKRGSSSNPNGSDQRRSAVEVPPVPPLPVPSTSRLIVADSQSGPGSSPALSVPSSPMAPSLPNGREKEKSSVNWFKRKSLRADKVPSSFAADRGMSPGGHGSDDNSGPWYKPKRVSRRASELGLSSLSPPSTPVSSVPPSVAMPHARTMSPLLRPVLEGRNSAAEPVTPPEKSEKRHSRQRPSTAGGTIERPEPGVAPPMPLLPPSRAMPSGQYAASSPGGVPNGLSHHAIPNSPKPQRPHTSHAPMSPSSLGISSSNGTTSTLSESGSTTASSTGAAKPVKRASRKLSLTAPMLGFGRKEKEKRPQTPSTSFSSSNR